MEKEWKLVSNKDGSYCELYNLVKDPLEKNDLSKDNPEVVQGLLKKLKGWRDSLPPAPTGDVFSELRKK